MPALPQNAPLPKISTDLVAKVIRQRAAHGAAPGPSGWTEELLLPLLSNAPALEALTALISDIAAGRLNAQARDLLLRSRLIPVKKKNDGLRPVVVGEALVRVASLCLIHSLPPKLLQQLLAPLQLGIGSPNGVESAIHLVQTHLLTHPNHTLLSVDLANGFNSLHRHHMLRALFDNPSLSHLWRLAHWSYAQPSQLILSAPRHDPITFLSQRGARQGCVLGTLLFCLTIQPALTKIAQGLQDTSLIAIVDDINIAGPVDQVSVALGRILKEFPGLGLSLSPAKSALLWATHTPTPQSLQTLSASHDIPIHAGSLPLLGSIVGSDTKAAMTFASSKAEAHSPFFHALTHESMPLQNAYLLLRSSAVPRLNFLCRTLPPHITLDACQIFQAHVLKTALHLLQLPQQSLSQVALRQIQLPLRLGGLGLRSVVDTAPAAYLGSLAASAPLIAPICSPPPAPSLTILQQSLDHFNQCDDLKLPTPQHFFAHVANPSPATRLPPHKLQQHLSFALAQSHQHQLYKSLTQPLQAHLTSLSQKSPDHFLICSRLRR